MSTLRRYEDDAAPSRTLLARLRKLELEKSREIRCGQCPYHRAENRTHTSPHADVRKRKKARAARRDHVDG